jgi:gamma-glutamyltranspeptidase/glutathione hydrolase
MPVMAVGSPGSERIISAIVQVISLWVDAGMSIDDAVAYPRIHVTPDSIIFIESKSFTGDEISSVIDAGFLIESPPSEIMINNLNPYFGGVHAVAYENSKWKAAADPRRDGATGYGFDN